MSKYRFVVYSLLVLLSACSFSYNIGKQQTNFNAAAIPDAEIVNFTTDYSKMDRVLWELEADTAFIFSTSNITRMKNLSLIHYDEDGAALSHVQSDMGVLHNLTRNIKLRTNVVIISSNKTKLMGDYIIWNNAEEQLTSPIKVTVIQSNGDIITGSGMIADKGLETVRFSDIISEVTADKENL